MFDVIKCLCNCSAHTLTKNTIRQITYAKRFYKNVTVAGVPGSYEVNLDHRKLKTPLRSILQVPSYALALAIANEWNAVKGKIVPSSMHLTGLANTAIDNPSHVTKWNVAEKVIDVLTMDTLLFRDESRQELVNIQQKRWDPVVQWFNDRFNLNISVSFGIGGIELPSQATEVIRRHVLSYNFWSAFGLLYGIEAIKSVILTLAALEQFITAEEAVALSLLETEYQTSIWGSFEWAHDIDRMDLQARFSAALLFATLNSSEYFKVQKSIVS